MAIACIAGGIWHPQVLRTLPRGMGLAHIDSTTCMVAEDNTAAPRKRRRHGEHAGETPRTRKRRWDDEVQATVSTIVDELWLVFAQDREAWQRLEPGFMKG